ncbi:MAG TPA: DUF4386 family protein [Candidatus Cybelea sp.]|jgi:hypothetical protein|nr:DUF4386 family protein [Candidatus Cybelea sp.]
MKDSAVRRPPRAKRAGLVYLLYFISALLSEALVGHVPPVTSDAVTLLSTALYAWLALLLFALFAPVSKALSLTAALFAIAGCIVQELSLFHLATQREALFFFAFYCLLIGYLIFRSSFLPKGFGFLMMAAGLGWFVYLLPAIPRSLAMSMEVLGLVAELALMLRLLIAGVDVRRWNRRIETALR